MSIKSKKLKLIATATIVSLCATVVTTSTKTSALPGIPRVTNFLRTLFGISPKVPQRTTSLGPQSQPKPGLGARAAAWLREKFGLQRSSTSPTSTRPTPPPTPPMSSSGSKVLFKDRSDIVVDNDPYGQHHANSSSKPATATSSVDSTFLDKLNEGVGNLLKLKNNDPAESLRARNRLYKHYKPRIPTPTSEDGATGGIGISRDNFGSPVYQNIDADGLHIGGKSWGNFPVTDRHVPPQTGGGMKPTSSSAGKKVITSGGIDNPTFTLEEKRPKPLPKPDKNVNYAVLNFDDKKGTLGGVVSGGDKKVEYTPVARNDKNVDYNSLGARPKVRTNVTTGGTGKKVHFKDFPDSSSTSSTSSRPLTQKSSSSTEHQPSKTTSNTTGLIKKPKPVVPPKPDVVKTGDGKLLVKGTSDTTGTPTVRVVSGSQKIVNNKDGKKVPPPVKPKPDIVKSGDGALVVRGTSSNGDPTFRVVGVSPKTGNNNDNKTPPPVPPKKLKVRNVTQV